MVSPVTPLSRQKWSSSLFPRSGIGSISTLCCRNSRYCSASLPANVLALSDCMDFFPGPDSALNKRAANCGRSLGLTLCSYHKTSFSYSVHFSAELFQAGARFEKSRAAIVCSTVRCFSSGSRCAHLRVVNLAPLHQC